MYLLATTLSRLYPEHDVLSFARHFFRGSWVPGTAGASGHTERQPFLTWLWTLDYEFSADVSCVRFRSATPVPRT